MFRASSRPSSGAQHLQWQPLVLPSEHVDSSTVGRGRAVYKQPDHDQQYCYHHIPKVKPEAATAGVDLLMMGVRTVSTVGRDRAVYKRADHDQQYCYHHAPKVKPEAATAGVELL